MSEADNEDKSVERAGLDPISGLGRNLSSEERRGPELEHHFSRDWRKEATARDTRGRKEGLGN